MLYLGDVPADAELAEEHALQQAALVVLLAVVLRGQGSIQHGTCLVERVVATLKVNTLIERFVAT